MKRQLTPFWKNTCSILGSVILLVAVYQIFMLAPRGFTLQENSYYYIILGVALALVYLSFKPRKSAGDRVAWYDMALGGLGLGICVYFACNGLSITSGGWMFAPPNDFVTGCAVVLPLLVLEALRRTAGLALFAVCAFFLLYPTFAHVMPSFLEGQSLPLASTFTFHSLSPQSLVGIPIRVVCTLLIGYIIFGIVLNNTGGGQFFLDFATSLLGRYRGGAGKVAVLASSLFGSMSGSAISNVITTGSITIPAMKKSGFPPAYAGAIEACASTGGVLMPPIMGAAAFLMAQFLGIPYLQLVVAAIIPSLLYYMGLLVQLDAIAARCGITGLEPDQIPKTRKILAVGWPYLAVFFVLIYFLYQRVEAQAPFYAIIFILICLTLRGATRLSPRDYWSILGRIGQSIAELAVTIGAVGFIIGSMSLTGVGASISGELVALAGGNVFLMLLLGAIASFVLGMGMTTSACYIFLAITLAPGLVGQGFNAMAVHLFILYWAMISNITPPVAMACFPAANIAEAPYLKVGKAAMHFGFGIYLVPFIFVLEPALLFQGEPWECVYYIATAFIGVFLAASGLGRNMVGIGKLPTVPALLLVPLGLIIAWPLKIIITALALAIAVAMLCVIRRSNRPVAAENALQL